MTSKKRWTALCLAAAALITPISTDEGYLRIGTKHVLAMDCKPILICEEFRLPGYSWEVCVKVRVTFC